MINWSKSEVHFSLNVCRATKVQLCSILDMQECSHRGRYLGSPFCKLKSKHADFNFIAEKMAAKLSGWKSKFMSLAGRATLIRSVTFVIPSYSMQMFLLPVSLCEKFDRLNRHFLWGVNEDRKWFLALRSWDRICIPKSTGGLGLRRTRDVNMAFITKLGWQLCTELERMWVKLIWSRYLRGRRITDFQSTLHASSWIWPGIKKCKELLDVGLCLRIGQHSLALIREDPWIPNLPYCKIPDDIAVPVGLLRVRQLMNTDSATWSSSLIQTIFPQNISLFILSTPIFAGEQD